MKKSIIALMAILTVSTFAGEGKFTALPTIHGKIVSKVCYDVTADNFKYGSKVLSRVQYKKGDCTKKAFVDVMRHGEEEVELRCVARATKTILYPLTFTATVYDRKEVCEGHGGGDERMCNFVDTELYSYDYEVKSCN